MTVSELRFPKPGLKFYSQVFVWTAIGLAIIAWGSVGPAFNAPRWSGLLYWISGVSVIIMGLVLIGLVWLIFAALTYGVWRTFRQLRPPTVLIDASGVNYLAARRPRYIPWTDIEQASLERTIFRGSVLSYVHVRLTPGAAIFDDIGYRPAISADRKVQVGRLKDLAVSEDAVLRFLEKTSGTSVEITEDDRRRPPRGRTRG